jgi:Fur family transcriptional regulator, zinc uptake regulator
MPHDHHQAEGLTRNQKLVFEAMAHGKAPQSAYDLLDALRPAGLKAPLQIYRALDRLMELGLVHKLESLSAYVACQHPAESGHAATVFMICETCGTVAERASPSVSGDLDGLASHDGFRVSHSAIELRGRCSRC